MKNFTVTASMITILECSIEAENEDEAIEKAKEMAEAGEMTEKPYSGEIADWRATQS